MMKITHLWKVLPHAILAFALFFSFPLANSAQGLYRGMPAEGEKSEAEENIDKVIQKAETYMGTKHRWGDTTHEGIDCSGLMLVSFRAARYELPRMARDQARGEAAVKRDELKRGDLVFFKFKPENSIEHVGLVTEVEEGEVSFIHASKSQGVTISQLNPYYWDDYFYSARRIWEPQPITPEPIQGPITVVPEPPIEETPVVKVLSNTIVCPEASERVLSKKELKGKRTDELKLMKEELYARQGYQSPDNEFRSYFESQQWYQDIAGTKNFEEASRNMNDYERKNIKKIEKMLTKRS